MSVIIGSPLNDAQQSGNYKQYNNDNNYQYVSGLVFIPLAADTPVNPTAPPILPKVVRLHQPYSIRQQSFKAVKDQTPPIIPGPATDGDVLLSSTFNFPLPNLSDISGPAFLFTLSGSYTYLGAKPYSRETGYVGGTYPVQITNLENLQNIVGAIGGGLATTITFLNNLRPQYESGNYIWPYTNFIGSGFIDPNLSKTQSL